MRTSKCFEKFGKLGELLQKAEERKVSLSKVAVKIGKSINYFFTLRASGKPPRSTVVMQNVEKAIAIVDSGELDGTFYVKTNKKDEKRKQEVKAPSIKPPNPRHDLLRELILAARDPAMCEVMGVLSQARMKFNGRTEKAFNLLLRIEEEGLDAGALLGAYA